MVPPGQERRGGHTPVPVQTHSWEEVVPCCLGSGCREVAELRLCWVGLGRPSVPPAPSLGLGPVPAACPVRCGSRGRSSAPFHVLSRLFAASCASYNFSFLSPQGLSFASQGSSAPFWSGTAALGEWGAHSPCLQVSTGVRGAGDPAGRRGCGCTCLALRPRCCPLSTRSARWPCPSFSVVVPRGPRRALRLVAASSRAAGLGGGPHSGLEELWDVGAGGGVSVALTPWPLLPESEPSRLLCALPLCHGHCHPSIWTPGSRAELVQRGFQFGLGIWNWGHEGSGRHARVPSRCRSE